MENEYSKVTYFFKSDLKLGEKKDITVKKKNRLDYVQRKWSPKKEIQRAQNRFPDPSEVYQEFLLNLIYSSYNSSGTETLHQLAGNPSNFGTHQTHS